MQQERDKKEMCVITPSNTKWILIWISLGELKKNKKNYNNDNNGNIYLDSSTHIYKGDGFGSFWEIFYSSKLSNKRGDN